jgi:polygalacturonase
VLLSPGVWLSRGPIHLDSRIELHLERGAHLLSPDPAHYLPVVETRWEGTRVLGYSPLIYARGVEDVAITGPGTIGGNVESGFHAWHGLAQPDILRLRRMGFDGVPSRSACSGPARTCGPGM